MLLKSWSVVPWFDADFPHIHQAANRQQRCCPTSATYDVQVALQYLKGRFDCSIPSEVGMAAAVAKGNRDFEGCIFHKRPSGGVG